jgi:hypothetical protein
MRTTKFIHKVAIVGTMYLAFAGLAGQPAQGRQQTTSLFSTTCVGRGDYGSQRRDVTIGRELFTSIFRMADRYDPNGTSMTCRIRFAGSVHKFKTLRLAFGIGDSEYGDRPVDVNVYLDGNLAESRTLLIGEKALLLLNVSQTSSVAIEVLNNGDGQLTDVSFFQALLEPISSSSGQRY